MKKKSSITHVSICYGGRNARRMRFRQWLAAREVQHRDWISGRGKFLQARQQMMQMTNLRLPLSILTLMVKTATGITR
mgnify:CR=1 FL=1